MRTFTKKCECVLRCTQKQQVNAAGYGVDTECRRLPLPEADTSDFSTAVPSPTKKYPLERLTPNVPRFWDPK